MPSVEGEGAPVPVLAREGEVFLLHLDPDDENRFSPERTGAIEAALDEVDAAPPPKALVTTNTGKFWCTGLDLDHLAAHPDQEGPYVERFQALLARTLVSATPTVAAINGHAFAGGALWALAHDVRVMRADRGWFCLPEVDIDKVFRPGMAALVRARLAPAVAHEAMTTGRRYGGEEAAADRIVDAVTDAGSLLATAIELARGQAHRALPVRAGIKRVAYAAELAALSAPQG
jgi:Delta3-Delta2-enoyl-CoA isomerase